MSRHRTLRDGALPALLILTCSAVPLVALEEELPGPVTVRAGWSYLAPGTRNNISGHNGLALGAGLQDNVEGILGMRGVEALYRMAKSADGRVDDLGVAYVERIPWQNQVYGGLGAGLWGFRIDDQREGGAGVLWGLRPGVEGLVGYQFAPPADGMRLALEVALLAVLPAHTYTTSGFTVTLVTGF